MLAFGAELVEEDVECGVVAAGAGPHQVAAVVVDDDDQVAVAAFVGDLVDPDPTQSLEPVDGRVDVCVDAVTIEPTVRQATRSSSITALFDVRTASQAARSSKSRVWPAR